MTYPDGRVYDGKYEEGQTATGQLTPPYPVKLKTFFRSPGASTEALPADVLVTKTNRVKINREQYHFENGALRFAGRDGETSWATLRDTEYQIEFEFKTC